MAGVDLSTICINYHECDDHWLKSMQPHVEVIKAMTATGSEAGGKKYDEQQIVEALQAIILACNDANSDRICNAKKFLGGQGTHNLISRLLAGDDTKTIQAGLDAINVSHCFST